VDLVARPARDLLDVHARRDQKAIATALGQIGFALPGTVSMRSYRYGKLNCACHGDPPRLHGPSIQWTRKINGKTVNRRLTQAQWEDYRAWFDNARQLRTLLADLERLSLGIFERDERWSAGRTGQAPDTS
jgi:hypothetical protein